MDRINMYCRNCGAELCEGANFCPSCGYSVEGNGGRAVNPQTSIMMNHKSEGLTLILSVIITGAGHMYAGKVKEGIILLALQLVIGVAIGAMMVMAGGGSPFPFIVMAVGAIVAFIIWIYAIVDSDKVVKEYNARLMETGNPPW